MIKLVISCICIYFAVVNNVNANDYASINKLQTFFTTISERSKLDEMRRSGKFNKKQPGSAVSVSTEPKKVKVRGLVIRESGESVVWVNEGSTLKSRIIDSDIMVNTKPIKQNEKISLKVNGRQLIMKPGEEWNESSNKVRDSYQTK
ncbi:MAG: hypothetical protein OEY61_11315 [Gammaproteobacteria bacterium]|nr:hypothetical protein [Gammaproteobacteria bacterium]